MDRNGWAIKTTFYWKYGLWGITKDNDVFYKAISFENPTINGWTSIKENKFKYVSVDKYGVWAVNLNDEIFYREGISESNPTGEKWRQIEGLLKQISVGYYGLYGINFGNEPFTKDLKLK